MGTGVEMSNGNPMQNPIGHTLVFERIYTTNNNKVLLGPESRKKEKKEKKAKERGHRFSIACRVLDAIDRQNKNKHNAT
jgi:hypothetical protein